MPKISVRPDKITFYKEFVLRNQIPNKNVLKISPASNKALLEMGIGKNRVVDNNSHNFELSVKATKRIKDKINWLYHLSKIETITVSKHKTLYNFRMNFITLTLPCKQRHTTSEINEKCLNQFFTEIKDKFGVRNYVWRLEFQKNGNAHYHIATDTYINFNAMRYIWNRCINKLGYVDDYMNKNIGITFEEYRNKNARNNEIDFKTLQHRFSKGSAERWTKPNTVDVKTVFNVSGIGYYISKYITKKSEHQLNSIVKEREPQDTNLRLWFCSRSLSKLDKVTFYEEEITDKLCDLLNELGDKKTFIFDYCKVVYFNVKKQSNLFQRLFREFFTDYARDVGYYG